MAYRFHQLNPEQQSLAVRDHAVAFRSALARGSVSFCETPQDFIKTIELVARAMAEDAEYSERDIRTTLSVRTWENSRSKADVR
jgi:hypothetical protein